jgi:hypothetical protein
VTACAGNRVVPGQARIEEEQFAQFHLLDREWIVGGQILLDVILKTEGNVQLIRRADWCAGGKLFGTRNGNSGLSNQQQGREENAAQNQSVQHEGSLVVGDVLRTEN